MTEKTFEKYKLVVDEWFVNGFNGTKAYQKYYPKASDETADSKFRELVGKGRIDDYVKSKQNHAQKSLRTSHEVLLQELENWAYSDITETLELSTDDLKKLPKEVRRLITSYKKSTTHFDGGTKEVIELKFVSKERAMEMIHKHTGFYEADNAQKAVKIPILTIDPLNDKDNDGTTED